MAARKGDSRESLLDAAESLFAEQGYEETTTRQIVKLSGDTLGTLSYHFGGKQNLLEAILRRRFDGVGERRLVYYREMIDGPGGVSVPGTVRAIIQPFLDLGLSGDQGWRSYITLLGRIRESGNPQQRIFFSNFASPYVRQCIDWLGDAAPTATDTQIAYCYEFCMTLAIQFSGDPVRQRIARLAPGHDWEFGEHRENLLLFANAGVAAILAGR